MVETTPLDEIFGKLREEIDRMVSAAHAQGIKDGEAQALERVAAAIQSDPLAIPPERVRAAPPALPSVLKEDEKKPNTRAPKGLVKTLIDAALEEKGALRIADLEEIIASQDDRVAIKSVGNHLRRFEGETYKRDETDGRLWLLIEKEKETEDTVAGSPVSFFGHSERR